MEKAMQKYLDKAEVLIEALPYIQRFNRKIIVVKYGGSAMVDEELKARVIQDVTLLKLVGFKPIIVHGGGKEISKWVGKVGMEPQFINGLRVTDAETMELAEMVLGKVNKSLVQLVEQLGVRAIGISGKDGGLLKVDKKLADGEDIGFVGDVKEVNADIIYDLVCHFIGQKTHHPLRYRRDCSHHCQLEQHQFQIREAYQPLLYHTVHTFTNQNGRIQGSCYCDCRQHQNTDHQIRVRANQFQDTVYGLFVFHNCATS